MTLEELKKRYDGKKIADVEAQAKRASAQSLKNRKAFIEILFYLEKTSRFRENPAYKKSRFELYLMNMFSMSMATYNTERYAFIHAEPEFVQKYGARMAGRVLREHGVLKAKKVMEQIAAKDATAEQAMEIIKESAPPKPIKAKVPPICVDCERHKGRIRELEKENAELRAQNEKLKATIRRLRPATATGAELTA